MLVKISLKQRTATIGRTWKQCQGDVLCVFCGYTFCCCARFAAQRAIISFRSFRAPVWTALPIESSQMSTEASQRGSGPLSTDRVTGRLRGPAPAEPSLDSSTQSPANLMRRMSPAEFNTAMIHFYRGEVQRSNTWRNRLDTTTNWAVITAGATLSFVFSSNNNPHFVIPINSILVAIFLLMEARRYRYYEIWSSRVRILETGYFANLLMPENRPADEAWAEHLAADLTTPHFTITEWEAVGRRLRRNYLWIFALLALSWNLKVYLHPLPARDFNTFIDRAEVGIVPGWIVFVVGIVFNAAGAWFCDRNAATARSDRRSVTETRVLIATVETNDELDRGAMTTHDSTCETRAPTCAQPRYARPQSSKRSISPKHLIKGEE